MQEYVPLRNMHVFIAAQQKIMKTYYSKEWCNDKMLWLKSEIKLNYCVVPIMKKFAEAKITNSEHLLSPGKQYLSYDDLMLKFSVPQNHKDFLLIPN